MMRMTCTLLSVLITLVITQAATPVLTSSPAPEIGPAGSRPHTEPENAARWTGTGDEDEIVASRPESQPAMLPSVRFAVVDIYVSSDRQPLAAYQCEMTAVQGDVMIVGIEGGDHAAFKEPPYYDPAALMNNRVILAAFNTGAQLPTGKSRVARIHVRISGDTPPQYEMKLITAGSSDGRRIEAKITLD